MFLNFDQVFRDTVEAYSIIDHTLRLTTANDAYCALVGRPREALIGQRVFDLFPETLAREALFATAFEKALSGEAAQVDEVYYSIPLGDQSVDRWWTIYCTPLEGAPPCFLFHIKDVTEVIQSRKQRDLYSADLQHRVGNVLNVVQVLARRTGQTAQTHADFLAAFDERIAALGKTFAHLSGDNWNGTGLHDLLAQQLLPEFLNLSKAVVIDGPDWPLSAMHAQTFAMAIHELLTNAIKAGALGDPKGQVAVTWGREDDGSYWFQWFESGLQGLEPPTVSGFGTQTLLIVLPHQLGGSATQEFTPTGMHYRLTIPADVEVPVGQDVGAD